MMESLQISAQLTTVLEVDLSAIARLRSEHKDDFLAHTGVKLSFLPFSRGPLWTCFQNTACSTRR